MIKARKFGELPCGEIVTAYDFTTEAGFRATILSYGATLQSLTFPDGTDIVLGFDNLEDYLGDHPCFGATIGRVANRIGGASFEIDGVCYDIPANEGANSLHSGPEGFDRMNWAREIEDDTLILRHTSPDGHQGFPGNLRTELRFRFEGTTLSCEMKATTDKVTPVNLTYHPYFNLTDGGASPCADHMLEIKADNYMLKDNAGLPTGKIKPCIGSANDYTKARLLNDASSKSLDHSFIRSMTAEDGMFKLAKLWSETTGHKVIICSTQPCLQAYTGKFIPEIRGKAERVYGSSHGVALEPQGFTDSLNHEAFPDSLLLPGEAYNHKISYTFRPGEAQA